MFSLSKDMMIGNHMIDNDHQKLVDIINEFELKSQENSLLAMHETLKELLKYSKYHFEREEKLQKESGYPHYQMHKSEHATFIYNIKLMAKSYFVDKTKPIDEKATKDIINFMQHWLVYHIEKFDTLMKEYIN